MRQTRAAKRRGWRKESKRQKYTRLHPWRWQEATLGMLVGGCFELGMTVNVRLG